MEATIGVSPLKSFTKCLSCLVRYGDEVTIHATPEWLSLSVVGVNRTSFCRFKFSRDFFDRYRVGKPAARLKKDETSGRQEREDSEEIEEVPHVVGLIMGKLLLAVLRGTGTEKSPEKCRMELVEGIAPNENADDGDSIETRLLVKLHYKHGVVKTHTFALASSDTVVAPALPTDSEVSTIQIGGRTLKELVDHFHKPEKRSGSFSEPLLIWQFLERKTTFKTEDQWNSAKGDWIGKNTGKGKRNAKILEDGDDDGALIYSSLNSHLSLDETEFDLYQVHYPPVTLGLHMKELSATMTVAEALGADITVRFTSHGLPIFFSIDSAVGTYNCFCALSTKVLPEGDKDGVRPAHDSQRRPTSSRPLMEPRKRPREMDTDDLESRGSSKRRTVPSSNARQGPAPLRMEVQADVETGENEELSFANVVTSTQRGANGLPFEDAEEPLFYPSQAIQPSQVLQEAGFADFESMSERELQAMLRDDMEVEVDRTANGVSEMQVDADDNNSAEDDWSMASQLPATQEGRGDGFTPLFDD